MRFGVINHIILFGGSRLLAELSLDIIKNGEYRLSIYTCDRQLAEPLFSTEQTLEGFLKVRNIEYRSAVDINSDPTIGDAVTDFSLGLGLGEAWSFSKDLVDRFQRRLLDFMGIRLPQYRGGAHYTWQILRQNKIGCCNLQIINEDMVQGVFDSGEIVKSKGYLFPPSARIPMEYFDHAVQQELAFIKEFLKEVKTGKDFELSRVQEDFSIHFPRLNTRRHGFINWDWDTKDIERFICAFDDPYPGASTFINMRRLHLKKCYSEPLDGLFHPFQAGLIYRITADAVFIASRGGTLIVKEVLDEAKRSVLKELKLGQRFFTPHEHLEEAMLCSAEYSEKGLV